MRHLWLEPIARRCSTRSTNPNRAPREWDRSWLGRAASGGGQAAAYVDVGTTKFDEMVADRRMPKPKEVDGCVIWDREELDQSFDALGPGESQSKSVSRWDQVED